MQRTARVFLVLLASGIGVAASADSILVSDGRQIVLAGNGLGCAIEEEIFLASAPFAPFDESHTSIPDDPESPWETVTASQSSFVQADQMGGTGTASNSMSTHFCSQSIFSVTFQLTASSSYDFDATLVTDAGFEPGFGSVRLTGSNGTEFDYSFGNGPLDVQESGVLPAGEYTLYLLADSYGGTATWEFAFQLVPEPASAALLAVGLVSLGARRGNGARA